MANWMSTLEEDSKAALEKRRADARALWAVRVLDAYAEAGPRVVPQIEHDRRRGVRSLYVWVDGARLEFASSTIPAARLAAAQAVYPTLPADVRAKLGECP